MTSRRSKNSYIIFFIGSSVQDGMLSQDSTYQGDRNPNATDGGFLSQL